MNQKDSEVDPSADTDLDASPAAEAATGPTASGIIIMLALSLIAGAVAAPALENYYEYFPMVSLTPEETNLVRADPNDPVAWAIERNNRWVWLYRNSSLGLGLFGAILGGCLGMAEGIRLRSVSRLVLLSACLAVCGAVAGILAGVAAAAFALRILDDLSADPTQLTLAMHAAAFAVLGAGIGLGFALLTRKWSAILRCACGGVVAGIVFLPLASFLFPLAQTDVPIPETLPAKLLFLVVGAGLIGFCVGRAPLRTHSKQ